MDEPKTKEERVSMLLKWRSDAEEGNRPTFKRMSKCERFKVGKQWDADVISRNESRRQFSLTINHVLPTVNQVTGTEVQNPRDIQVLNTRGSSRKLASLLSALTKQTMDTSYTRRQSSMMFDDGVTTARGWIGADYDYSKDPANADIVVKKYDPFMVIPDPNRRHYDLNKDAKYVIVDEWVDKEKLEIETGKKEELMSTSYASQSGAGRYASLVNFIFDRHQPGSVQDDYRDHENTEEGGVSSVEKYKYRKSTYWWKKWKRVVFLQKIDDPLNYLMFHKKSDIRAARNIAISNREQVRLIDKDKEGNPLTAGILQKTVMVGNVHLSHKEDPFNGINLFPIVPYCAYFQNGYEFGLVQNLIGPQEQVNWSWSMELNLIKKLANVGWKVGGTIDKWRKWLKAHGSEDGIVLDETKFGKKIEKLEMNQFPVGFDLITEKGSRHISEISNVRLESPQTDKDRVASAIRLKQASAFTGSATLFSNYDYTMELLGGLVVAFIRKTETFSEEEIRQIVDKEDLVDPEMLGEARQMIIGQLQQAGHQVPEQPVPLDMNVLQGFDKDIQQAAISGYQLHAEKLQQFHQQIDAVAKPIAVKMLLAELKNLHKGRFDTKVSLAPMAETMRVIKAIETMELNKVLIESQHQPLSRRRLIEAVDPANKDTILAEENI